MDFTPIINQVLNATWYLIPLFILISLFKTPWFKGIFGEFQVNVCLRLFLPNDKYHLIKNVTLPTQDGSTQIDHVLVSQYGVFVIETKNMRGWIFGSTHNKQWTQKIYKYSTRFQNPLHQNYKHVKVLESCLNIPLESIFSVIVFVGDSTFKTDMPTNVTYAGGCIRYIKAIDTEVISQEQVHNIISIIEAGRIVPSIKTNREHVTHVKKIIIAKSNEKLCPKCKSIMVLRESKKGRYAGKNFWGCSTFPKCRGIVNVT